MPRYVPVVVGRYLDGPARIQAITCWAVADRELANSIVSQKFDTRAEAQAKATQLEIELVRAIPPD